MRDFMQDKESLFLDSYLVDLDPVELDPIQTFIGDVDKSISVVMNRVRFIQDIFPIKTSRKELERDIIRRIREEFKRAEIAREEKRQSTIYKKTSGQ